MGVSDKTARSYLDILTGTFMVRQLQPWFENIGKRQVKSPKVYFRDSGLLHSLLGLTNKHSLLGHPKVGASWEGYVLEQLQQIMRPGEVYFWATHGGAELDFFFVRNGRRYGVEVKYSEAPKITRSMRIAVEDLGLEHIWVIYPGRHSYPVDDRITVWPLHKLSEMTQAL
jgi:predicted AAA+ superfamily ATPase